MSECPRCGDRQWTCEAHPDQPFEHKLENGEICPGPGDPCVECNPMAMRRWEDDDFVYIESADGSIKFTGAKFALRQSDVLNDLLGTDK